MRRFAVILLISFVSVFLAAPGGAWAATSPARNGVPAQASDSLIAANLRAKLAKSKIGADGFKFHVEKGVVTWEGHTDVPQHKGAATRMAHTAGALQVINKIEVSAAGKAKASASLHRATVSNQ